MASSNSPKHGDPIIEQQASKLGGSKLIASSQFQRFLDEISALVIQSDDSEQQDIVSISVQIGKNTARLNTNASQIDEILDGMASANTENARLKAIISNHVQSFNDLEQVVYGS